MIISIEEKISPAQIYNTLVRVEGVSFLYLATNWRNGCLIMRDLFNSLWMVEREMKHSDQWSVTLQNGSRIVMIPKKAMPELLCGRRADIVLVDSELEPSDDVWVRPLIASRGIEADGYLKPRGIFTIKI